MSKITTGEVLVLNSRDVPTVRLPNEGLDISINGSWREKERKLWAFLVHYAFENFGSVRVHEIKCSDVAHVFRSITGCGRTKDLWKYVENLCDIKVIMKDGNKSEGFAHLLSWAYIDHEAGVIKYEIPSILEEILSKPQYQFSRLRTHFLIGLSGKYSVSLYMLLEMYANRNYPILELSLDELRNKLRIEAGKLARWQDLRRFVIEPAIKEINEKTIQECEDGIQSQHGAGFTVAYETVKKSRKITGVKFVVSKHQKRIDWEEKLKKTKTKTQQKQKILPLIKLNWDKVRNMINKKKFAGSIDMYAYESEWRDWLWKTGKSDTMQSPEASYVGFIQNKV